MSSLIGYRFFRFLRSGRTGSGVSEKPGSTLMLQILVHDLARAKECLLAQPGYRLVSESEHSLVLVIEDGCVIILADDQSASGATDAAPPF